MTAKHKLNAAYTNGALVMAAVAGIMFESWIVFLIVAGVLIAGGTPPWCFDTTDERDRMAFVF